MIMRTANNKSFRAKLRENTKLPLLKIIMIRRILKVKMKNKKSNRHRNSNKLQLQNRQRIEVQFMAMVRLKFKKTQGLFRLSNLRKTRRPLQTKEIFTLWTIFSSRKKAPIQKIIVLLKLLTINKNNKQKLSTMVDQQYSVGRDLSLRRLIMLAISAGEDLTQWVTQPRSLMDL